MKPYFHHISVLKKEVVDYAPPSTQTILDCTLGGGGHSHSLLDNNSNAFLYGIDRDSFAVKAADRRLKHFNKQTRLAHASFSELPILIKKWGYPCFDYISSSEILTFRVHSHIQRSFV